MVYLHGSDERQQVIAGVLSRRAAKERGRSRTGPSGTQRARRRGWRVVSIDDRCTAKYADLEFS
jgi:hypothetical protein